MPTPESRLPVDPTVVVPASVRRATELAEAAHKAVYGDPAPAAPAPDAIPVPADPAVTPPATPAAEATPPATPAEPTPPPQPAAPAAPAEPVSAEEWQHRYNSMKGRFEQSSQTTGTLQEQLREMSDELMRVNAVLNQRHAQPEPQRQVAPKKLVTKADVDTYGPELVDLIQRAAVEAIAPELQHQRREIQQTRQRVASNTVHQALASAIPDWEQINENPRFLSWCNKRDIYSGQVRSEMLTKAFQAADAPRVIAFFRGFLTEEAATGNALPTPTPSEPATPRVAAVPLESLAAPGKARPASEVQPSAMPDGKPVFTHKQVADFYTQVRQQKFAGREAEKQRIEQSIILAGREGRVR